MVAQKFKIHVNNHTFSAAIS